MPFCIKRHTLFLFLPTTKASFRLPKGRLNLSLLYYYLLYYFFIALRSFLFTVRTTVFTTQTVRPQSKSQSKLKNRIGIFVLRFGFRWRFPTRDFIKIIAIPFALDQIPFFNHQVYIVVERSPANAGVSLCVLLR